MSAEPVGAIRTGIFLRWWRFNLVGGIGIALQLALLFFLKSVLDFNYLAATGVAVEATVMHNFLWHERYTWMDRVRPSWRGSPPRLLRFHLTNGAVSIAGNLALMKILVGVGHLNYMAANAAAIVVCSLFNFLVSDAYVFERESSRQ
jgi:putative flippase GtrA